MNEQPTQSIPQQGRKWLKGVAPDEPLSTAARVALSDRLRYVAAYLPQAATADARDPEPVHQLRVGSRRAAAALAAFGPCLPKKRSRKMARRLRQIRRAAGSARELDVLIPRLAASQEALDPAERNEVLQFLAEQRTQAQPGLVKVAAKLPEERFERKIHRLVKRIRWRGDGDEPTLRAFGEHHVREVADAFLGAAREITRDSSVEALHMLRIAAKRLRYTIELFACTDDGTLRRTVYPLVEDLQERLGAMNDHASAEQYFRKAAQRSGSSGLAGKLNRLANHELQATLASVVAFGAWWNEDRLEEIYHGATKGFPPPAAA